MRTLEVDTDFGKIYFTGDALYQGHDLLIKANAPLRDIEIILFFDSRGISANWDSSLLKMLFEFFQTSKYLIVARPLELTTWATLYNFFRLNELRPALLITNVGIVDFTPKKYTLCQSMVRQIRFSYELGDLTIQPLERYRLSNGQQEMLFSVNYPEQYKLQLKNFFQSIPTIAIKTPIVDPGISIERKRPPSFFSQLHKTNEFIDALGCSTIDLGTFDHRLTYDAVHWTQEGNTLALNKILNRLQGIEL